MLKSPFIIIIAVIPVVYNGFLTMVITNYNVTNFIYLLLFAYYLQPMLFTKDIIYQFITENYVQCNSKLIDVSVMVIILDPCWPFTLQSITLRFFAFLFFYYYLCNNLMINYEFLQCKEWRGKIDHLKDQ